jgi:hypothetical protein
MMSFWQTFKTLELLIHNLSLGYCDDRSQTSTIKALCLDTYVARKASARSNWAFRTNLCCLSRHTAETSEAVLGPEPPPLDRRMISSNPLRGLRAALREQSLSSLPLQMPEKS